MISHKQINPDVNGIRAALIVARESDKIAAELRISLISNSSEGLMLDALREGYLKKTKILLIMKLMVFSLNDTILKTFGFGFMFCWKTSFTKRKNEKFEP